MRRASLCPCVVLLTLLVAFSPASARPLIDRSAGSLAEIVDGLKKRLNITSAVTVNIVATEKLAVSVEPVNSGTGGYKLSIDEHFLNQLDEEELPAALAHELGHVWIYTHHPFLQTEAYANNIAMKVVKRETLERLYGKLWAFLGTQGNLNDVLDPEPRPAN